MKGLTALACCLAIPCLEAHVSLKNLIPYDKVTCLERLEQAEDAELWDVFLEGQTQLFSGSELRWIASQAWWQQSSRILEIGSGNGAYLSKLSLEFPEKRFQGIEKQSQFVTQSNALYAKDNVAFQEGDAEIFDPQLSHSADVVLFRLTLQHLQDATTALKIAARYLSSHGHVLIIDSCDMAKRTSHPIVAIDEALLLVAEAQRSKGKGNRRITLELLQDCEVLKLYEVAFSNLDIVGNILCDITRIEGERDRKLYFNHNLLFLTLLHRTYQIPVDLNKAYDELQDYLKDESAWTSPGVHYLVLRRKQ